jgi:hypothetical protein
MITICPYPFASKFVSLMPSYGTNQYRAVRRAVLARRRSRQVAGKWMIRHDGRWKKACCWAGLDRGSAGVWWLARVLLGGLLLQAPSLSRGLQNGTTGKSVFCKSRPISCSDGRTPKRPLRLPEAWSDVASPHMPSLLIRQRTLTVLSATWECLASGEKKKEKIAPRILHVTKEKERVSKKKKGSSMVMRHGSVVF